MIRRAFLGLTAAYVTSLLFPGLAYGRKNMLYTFDDNPYDKERMSKFIEILKQNNLDSQFYFIGKGIKKFPESVNYVLEQGYLVGWHSMHHDIMSKKNDKEFLEDVLEWKNVMNDVAHGYEPKYARFPYGSGTIKQIKILNDEGLVLQKCATKTERPSLNWDISSEDWNPYRVRSAKEISKLAGKINSNNQIVLLLHLTLDKPFITKNKATVDSLITSDLERFQGLISELNK